MTTDYATLNIPEWDDLTETERKKLSGYLQGMAIYFSMTNPTLAAQYLAHLTEAK